MSPDETTVNNRFNKFTTLALSDTSPVTANVLSLFTDTEVIGSV